MFHFLIEKFQNLSFKLKIQGLILFSVFLISLTGFAGLGIVSKTYDITLYHSLSSTLSYSATIISERLTQTEALADMIFSDPLIQQRLALLQATRIRSDHEIYKTEIYNQLANYYSNQNNQTYDYLSYVTIFQDETVLSTKFSRSDALPREVRQNLFDIANSDCGRTIWVTDYAEEYGIFLVKTIREIDMLSLKPLGILVINIDNDGLLSSAAPFYENYTTPYFLLSEKNTEIYHSPELGVDAIHDLTQISTSSYFVFSLDGVGEVFAVKGQISGHNWDYTVAIDYSDIMHTISLARSLCLIAMLLSLVIVLLSSSKMLSVIIRHFDILIEKMNQFGAGTYDATLTDSSYNCRYDEIGKLHQNFNLMATQINTLIQENYINELLKKDAQLKALESQIEPHFIYNTLDSINWRANAIGAQDIVQITTALGNLLRVSLSKQQAPFTLKQELLLVDNYMNIQKLRYPQRLQYSADIPECYLDVPVPKFTIQPLVENAIRYGLEEMIDECQISVKAYTSVFSDTSPEREMLCIEIANNGSSFDDHLLEKLDSGETLPHGFGIGMLNIHKRLLIAYGSPCGLYLSNRDDSVTGEQFAVVKIICPLSSNP